MPLALHSIDFLYSLGIEVLKGFALAFVALVVGGVVALVCRCVSYFPVCAHYLVLEAEICLVAAVTVGLEFDDVGRSYPYDELLEGATDVIHVDGFIVKGQRSVLCEMQGNDFFTVYIPLLMLLFRIVGWQLPLQSFLSIHGSGDKEEDEQHE